MKTIFNYATLNDWIAHNAISFFSLSPESCNAVIDKII